ncbi:MAG: heme exporter protein CcmB [Desulfovibrio sp.]|nr:heme exporter protein CcmB [Desulfovibrio sp.]
MFRIGLAFIRKDILLLLGRGSALCQALLLGLVVIFVFSLGQSVGEKLSPQGAATVFWLSSLFCQVLLATQLFAIEEVNQTKIPLLMLPIPTQVIWLSKTITALMTLLLAQLLFLPATLIFLGQTGDNNFGHAFLGLLLVDLGLCSLSTLLGALAQGQGQKESLLSLLLFPLLTPLLLAGISIFAHFLGEPNAEIATWFAIASAFDALFLGAGCLLFPSIYSGDA